MIVCTGQDNLIYTTKWAGCARRQLIQLLDQSSIGVWRKGTVVKQNTQTDVWVFCFSKQTALLAATVRATGMFSFLLEMKTAEAGSRALTRIGTT